MANINLSGVLRDPLGEVSYGNTVKFTHETTTGETIGGFASALIVEINGEYDIDLEYGNVLIESYDKINSRWIKHGTFAINSETPATSLPELIGVTNSLTDPDLLIVQNLVADSVTAKNESITASYKAESSAARAEIAADSAALNSNIYETTVLGLASTVDGEYFSIPSSSGLAYIELYKNDGGMAEYIDAYPNKTYVEDVVDNFQFDGPIGVGGEDVAFAITDESGSSAMIFGIDGEVEHSNMQMLDPVTDTFEYSIADENDSVAFGVTGTGSTVMGGVETSNEYNKDYEFAITDEYGSVAFGIDKDGTTISSNDDPTPISGDWGDRYTAEDMYIEWYGQSLSVAAHGLPVISDVQNYSNVMMGISVLWDSDQDLTYYAPMVEVNNYDDDKGETGLVVMTDYLSVNDDDYTTDGTRYIGSASGLGGQPIANLTKGGIIYTRLTTRLQAGYDLSNAEGRSFNLWQLFFTQGEADYVAGTLASTWKEELIQLQTDLSEDAQDISGQDFKVPVIMYQCAAHLRQGVDYPNIAIAQAELAKSDEEIYVANAMYNFDYHTDLLHLTADGYVMLGKYYGAAAQELKETGTVSNLNIERVVTQGKVVEVQLNVPNPPLVIDTTRVTEYTNYGFDIYTNDVLNDIIDTVEIVGEKVKITTTIDVPTGSQLRYANGRTGDPVAASRLTGPRGNIRDSRGDTLNWINSTGDTDRADNWLLISAQDI